MTQEHPITPPPELLARWEEDWHYAKVKHIELEDHIATEAARWGADQELEACCEWLEDPDLNVDTYKLRATRRPKQMSLKEQSLKHLEVMERDEYYLPEILQSLRRALEQLDD